MPRKPVTRVQLLGGGTLLFVAYVTYTQFLFEFGVRLEPAINRQWFDIALSALIALVLLVGACRAVELAMHGWSLLLSGLVAFTLTSGLYTMAYGLRTGFFMPIETYLFTAPTLLLGVSVYFTVYAGRKWNLWHREELTPPIWDIGGPVMQECLSNLRHADKAAILQYYSRAQTLTEKAESALHVMIAVLTFTGVFMIFAGRILELDVAGPDHIELMARERNVLERAYDRTREELLMVLRSSEIGRTRTPPEVVRPTGVEISTTTIEGTLRHFRERIDEYDKKIFEARRAYWSRDAGVEEGVSEGRRRQLLLTSAVARLGVVVVAIYLVQILLSLYRYNTRTAADYLAQADALMLAGLDPKVTRAVHAVLLPRVQYTEVRSNILQSIFEAFRRERSDKKKE